MKSTISRTFNNHIDAQDFLNNEIERARAKGLKVVARSIEGFNLIRGTNNYKHYIAKLEVRDIDDYSDKR